MFIQAAIAQHESELRSRKKHLALSIKQEGDREKERTVSTSAIHDLETEATRLQAQMYSYRDGRF